MLCRAYFENSTLCSIYYSSAHCLQPRASADDDEEVFFRPPAKFACILLFYTYLIILYIVRKLVVIIYIAVESRKLVPRCKSKISMNRIFLSPLEVPLFEVLETRKIHKSIIPLARF